MQKHGLSYQNTYRVWLGIRARCQNPNHPAYPDYGGRGIKLCDEWQDVATFMAAVGDRPTPKHEIDRIDNDRGYEPGNVRWTTRTINSRNRRSTTLVQYRGETVRLIDLCDQHRIRTDTVKFRLRKGWTVEAAIETPARPKAPNGPRERMPHWRCVKLSNDAKRAMVADYARGDVTHAQLAERYGCRPSTVGAILQDPRWRHTAESQ